MRWDLPPFGAASSITCWTRFRSSTSCWTVRTCLAFVDGDVGFLNVRQRPFHVGAGGVAEAVRMQAAAQGGFGGA